MTNFEKWKAGLKVQDVAEMFFRLPCRMCPKQKDGGCRPLGCVAEFCSWANAEAGEDNNA